MDFRTSFEPTSLLQVSALLFLSNLNLMFTFSISAGYKYHAGGRNITIFSCSNYCRDHNEAAAAYVYDSQIRVLEMDTFIDK